MPKCFIIQSRLCLFRIPNYEINNYINIDIAFFFWWEVKRMIKMATIVFCFFLSRLLAVICHLCVRVCVYMYIYIYREERESGCRLIRFPLTELTVTSLLLLLPHPQFYPMTLETIVISPGLLYTCVNLWPVGTHVSSSSPFPSFITPTPRHRHIGVWICCMGLSNRNLYTPLSPHQM